MPYSNLKDHRLIPKLSPPDIFGNNQQHETKLKSSTSNRFAVLRYKLDRIEYGYWTPGFAG